MNLKTNEHSIDKPVSAAAQPNRLCYECLSWAGLSPQLATLPFRKTMMLTTIFVLLLVLIALLVVGFIVLYRKLTERKVTIRYETVIYYDKKLFREKVVAGYRTHIYYDGLPFGEPSESIVYRSNEVDREAIAAAITSAMPILTTGLTAALGVVPIELSEIQETINKVLNA